MAQDDHGSPEGKGKVAVANRAVLSQDSTALTTRKETITVLTSTSKYNLGQMLISPQGTVHKVLAICRESIGPFSYRIYLLDYPKWVSEERLDEAWLVNDLTLEAQDVKDV